MMEDRERKKQQESVTAPPISFQLLGEEVYTDLAAQLGIPVYRELPPCQLPKEIYKKIPYAFVKKNFLIPLFTENGAVVVAIADPLHLEPLEELRYLLDCPVKPICSTKEAILSAIHDSYEREHGAASRMIARLADETEERGDGEMEVHDLLDDHQAQAPIIKLLNLILTEAIQQGASDIHFEPFDSGLRLRYRIDGVLQNRHTPAQELQGPLLTRIKVMAKMDIAEHRLPQDGRIKLRMGRREIDFRVSTVPVSGGERIVMRILDKGNVILGLDKIGMAPETFSEFRRLISFPEGVVLVTGPTGSGKTTTLYSAICDLSGDEKNIMTIEDPVEYNLKGIAQIGVHHKIKLDFATGLRHILRQDPDIIMVGEIRDVETAEIAIQASLTGHLVLSTLHTNDAPSAITRLVDMGIEPYLLSSCVAGILAQRLVRKICPDCQEPYLPTEQELYSLGFTKDTLSEKHLIRGRGCSSCYGSGYKGRVGIYELLTVNNEIKKQMIKSPDAVELRHLALRNGMTSLLQHGGELVKQGVTTTSEVLRVSRGVDEV